VSREVAAASRVLARLTRRNIQAAREMDPKTPDKASCGVNWTEEPTLTSVSMRGADLIGGLWTGVVVVVELWAPF